MNDIEWEDPPPNKLRAGARLDVKAFKAALVANPGKWAVLTRSYRSAWAGRQIHPDFEWRTKKNPDGTTTIWGMYPGEKRES